MKTFLKAMIFKGDEFDNYIALYIWRIIIIIICIIGWYYN